MFRKILIANRGEIAVRLIRACRELGVTPVAVYSEADRGALHVRMADEAWPAGPAPAAESYLDIERLLDAARRSGAEAVHPGYGFLSENAEFAEACGGAGLKFIGPRPEAIRAMGSKTEARRLMQQAGVPIVPGTVDPVTSVAQAAAAAAETGFPAMLKAAAGGGGKGMRLVCSAGEIESAFRQASSEALRSFGDGAVYVEKAVVQPRHIEVQVLADEQGRTIHLLERECTLQRRHQKVLEESPSPCVEAMPGVRERLTAAAVRAAEAVGYVNAGTVEMLMDAEGNFYFLEMNTRLQVEHPVTEWITGCDLVHEQIRIAAGEPLRYRQKQIRARGHAIECRIYAEDPARDFLPSPGRIERIELPSGPGVRVDSGVYSGWRVPVEYDPLLAKLVVWAADRPAAIARLRRALEEFYVAGIQTNLEMFRALLEEPAFQQGEFDTGSLGKWLAGRPAPVVDDAPLTGLETAAVAAVAARQMTEAGREKESRGGSSPSPWKELGRRELLCRGPERQAGMPVSRWKALGLRPR